MFQHPRIRTALAAAAVLAGAGVARADVIDGDWCSTEGRHFSIRGPNIVTPEGTKTEGNYSRHSFSYTIPPSEPSAGTQVFMVLLNEFTVRLRTGTDPGAPAQIWKRCDQTS
ncbi:MAG: hypothetical protein JOZ40_11155 [Methylobacteriaceae bacterium]|nr:hypothetical protein [Methylobacteriaceae bacterium]